MLKADKSINKEAVKLRAHHLFCVNTFSGDGYDRAFIDNMARVAEICASPARLLEIVEGVDDICSSCPFRDGATCHKTGRDVAAMDAAAEAALGVAPGQLLVSNIMRLRVEEAIRAGKYGGVCNGCAWLEVHCGPLIKRL